MTTDPAPSPNGDVRPRPPWAAAADPLLLEYYETEWGRPVHDERAMFERLSLGIFQTGLSWLTILRKRRAFREAFAGFDPDAVADFDDADVARLLADEGIIRNRRKIEATINNAQATVTLRPDGGLVDLVWSFAPVTAAQSAAAGEVADMPMESPESRALAKELKKRGFQHVGPVMLLAMMKAVGVVVPSM